MEVDEKIWGVGKRSSIIRGLQKERGKLVKQQKLASNPQKGASAQAHAVVGEEKGGNSQVLRKKSRKE